VPAHPATGAADLIPLVAAFFGDPPRGDDDYDAIATLICEYSVCMSQLEDQFPPMHTPRLLKLMDTCLSVQKSLTDEQRVAGYATGIEQLTEFRRSQTTKSTQLLLDLPRSHNIMCFDDDHTGTTLTINVNGDLIMALHPHATSSAMVASADGVYKLVGMHGVRFLKHQDVRRAVYLLSSNEMDTDATLAAVSLRGWMKSIMETKWQQMFICQTTYVLPHSDSRASTLSLSSHYSLLRFVRTGASCILLFHRVKRRCERLAMWIA
jgi:hypothetical protein